MFTMETYANVLVYGSMVFSVLFLVTVAIAKFVSHRIGVRYENTRRG